MSDDEGGVYANIREILGFLVGRVVVDVLQHDKDEWEDGQDSYIELLFDNGATLQHADRR